MNKIALITGISGQDGSYLAEFLLGKGYVVHGLIRRSSTFNTTRIDHIYQDPHRQDATLFLHYGDLSDRSSINRIISEVQPDEIYNLASMSHVRVSFDIPDYTMDVTGTAVVSILEAIRQSKKPIKLYQASSSEMFGSSPPPQDESTRFCPRSPYGIAKVAAHQAVGLYREGRGVFGCCGILFNHESERRGETFVTRKITMAAARIKLGLQKKIYLGNLHARRDWGYAADYVRAMWLMLQQDKPDDYIVCTGETHSVREFAELVFEHFSLKFDDHYVIDSRYYRPTEVDALCGNPAKSRDKLGWEPETTFEGLARLMADSDLEYCNGSSVCARGME